MNLWPQPKKRELTSKNSENPNSKIATKSTVATKKKQPNALQNWLEKVLFSFRIWRKLRNAQNLRNWSFGGLSSLCGRHGCLFGVSWIYIQDFTCRCSLTLLNCNFIKFHYKSIFLGFPDVSLTLLFFFLLIFLFKRVHDELRYFGY